MTQIWGSDSWTPACNHMTKLWGPGKRLHFWLFAASCGHVIMFCGWKWHLLLVFSKSMPLQKIGLELEIKREENGDDLNFYWNLFLHVHFLLRWEPGYNGSSHYHFPTSSFLSTRALFRKHFMVWCCGETIQS